MAHREELLAAQARIAKLEDDLTEARAEAADLRRDLIRRDAAMREQQRLQRADVTQSRKALALRPDLRPVAMVAVVVSAALVLGLVVLWLLGSALPV